jgi:hypothetical protein
MSSVIATNRALGILFSQEISGCIDWFLRKVDCLMELN